jgi:TfoX/Sxy family transcriptional regulator of competence genes
MGAVRRHLCMASSSDTVQYIFDQVGLGRRLSSKKMFGEFALYLDEKIVALVCDDQLFLKPTEQAKDFLGKVRVAPPYPGAKDYFLLTDELDDPDRLKQAVLITAKALPAPKQKVAKSVKRASRGKQGSTRSKVPAKIVGKKKSKKGRS